MNLRYRVELTESERGELEGILRGGKHPARRLKRAQILLAADAGTGHEQIARNVVVSLSTVYRTKQRFVEGNLPWALSERPRAGAARKLTSAAGGHGLQRRPEGPGPLDTGTIGGGNGETDQAREHFPGNDPAPPGGERAETLAARHVVHLKAPPSSTQF